MYLKSRRSVAELCSEDEFVTKCTQRGMVIVFAQIQQLFLPVFMNVVPTQLGVAFPFAPDDREAHERTATHATRRLEDNTHPSPRRPNAVSLYAQSCVATAKRTNR